MMAGSIDPVKIVAAQSGVWLGFIPRWFVLPQLVAFVVYAIAAQAETQQTPFDMSEAESELITGFANEYGGMRFGFMYLAEFSNMFVVSAIGTMLFFGGWQLPVGGDAGVVRPVRVHGQDLHRHLRDDVGARLAAALPHRPDARVLLEGPHPGLARVGRGVGGRPAPVARRRDGGEPLMWGSGILKGLRITMRNMLRGPITVQYPEQKLVLPERARWAVAQKFDADGAPKCTACLICVNECPDHVLAIDVSKDRGGKHIDGYVYEIGACMMCGLCVEACPFDAIEMSHEYELATDRRRLVRRCCRRAPAWTPPVPRRPREGGADA